MATCSFYVTTVKKRLVEFEANDFLEGSRRFLAFCDKSINSDDAESDFFWDLIYKGEVIEDERILEVSDEEEVLFKDGEVKWRQYFKTPKK